MGKKYSDFSVRGDDGVTLHLFEDEDGLLGFRTRMGERAYLDRNQVEDVQRFLKKWLKRNKPELTPTENYAETDSEPEVTAQGIFEDIGNMLSTLFGIQNEIPEDAEAADLVLVGSESNKEKILDALKHHLGLAKLSEMGLDALAGDIALEDSCTHYVDNYAVSWHSTEYGKIVHVKFQ